MGYRLPLLFMIPLWTQARLKWRALCYPLSIREQQNCMTKQRSSMLVLLLSALMILPGLGCRGGSREAKQALEPVTLTYWRVFDGSDAFTDVIDAYRRRHPNVRVEYRKLRFDEYRDELIQAFAEDRGPDIFAVHNTWMNGALPLIEPMPDTVRVAYQETRGTIRQETTVVVRNEPTMSMSALNDRFVQVAADDVVYPATESDGSTKNRIHGLPLSVDTMALYYNRDLLDAAGIPEPPANWRAFQEAVSSLTRYDARGDIAQSAAAIGTGENVERSADLLSLLMMQSGAVMTDARGNATFAERAGANRTAPGVEAMRFYTDFANPTKEVYTWDQSFTNSFDAFAAGQTAFFFGYSYHAPLLRARSERLNFRVAKVPQLEGANEINYANYWIETVSKKTDHPDWAWSFIQFAAREDNVPGYLNAAGRPTALRSLVLDQQDDEFLGPFAQQVLTAQNWYNGVDPDAADQIFEDLIDDVVDGSQVIEDALEIAQDQINQTLR